MKKLATALLMTTALIMSTGLSPAQASEADRIGLQGDPTGSQPLLLSDTQLDSVNAGLFFPFWLWGHPFWGSGPFWPPFGPPHRDDVVTCQAIGCNDGYPRGEPVFVGATAR